MHTICYWTVRDNPKDRKNVVLDIQEYAKENGDGYHSHIVWHDNMRPFDTEEDAKKYLEDTYKEYSDHAVPFLDYSDVKKRASAEKIEAQIQKLHEDKKAWADTHSVKTFKAQYVGCPDCGSKLSREHLKSEKCPLCHTDLRSKTTLEKLEWYDEKIKLAKKLLVEEIKKQKDKATVKWLIKFEFHS